VPYFSTDAAVQRDVAASWQLAAAASLARIYYMRSCVPPADVGRYLTDVPAIAVSGDQHIMLQNGEHTSSPGAQLPGLISFAERRRARKKAIVSWELAYAHGGYGCRHVPFGGDRASPKPRWVTMVSIAGPQFEMRYLEAEDFILNPDDEDWAALRARTGSGGASSSTEGAESGAAPLFPQYYHRDARLPFSGRKPTWAEAHAFVNDASVPADLKADVDIVAVPWSHTHHDEGKPIYLCGGAYRRCMGEDMWMTFTAFERWLACASEEAKALGSSAAAGVAGVAPPPDGAAFPAPKPQGWLQLPMVGLGFFAHYIGRYSLADMLLPRFVAGIHWALEQGTATAAPAGAGTAGPAGPTAAAAAAPAAAWRHLKVLQMCDFSSSKAFKLPTPEVAGVRVDHAVRRGLLDLTDVAWAGYTCGIVNAGDAFALPGNERGHGSVEAMLGENTSIRRGQVYLHNPWLLDPERHVPLESPLRA
jgi:hypothetical protein